MSKVVILIIYTLFMVIIYVQCIFELVSFIFTNMPVEKRNIWVIICI